MDLDQAFTIIDQVCSAHHGTRQDHVLMQTALSVLREAAYSEPTIVPGTPDDEETGDD